MPLCISSVPERFLYLFAYASQIISYFCIVLSDKNIQREIPIMRIDILTVLPEMIDGMINCSIVKRAQDKGLAEIHLHNLRDYTTNKWRRVDDYPFGGEAGMVMQIEPIDRAISALKSEREYDEVIYTSPDGETFNQPMANSMSLLNNTVFS